jgi:hypothetical protein
MEFESEVEVDRFLARFEAGEIPAVEWTHAAHVAMAAAYVLRYGPEEAFFRIRAGIHHLNWHHGTITTADRGYHETLTLFWTKVLEGFHSEHVELDRVALLNLAVATLPGGLFRQYYGFDVVKSRQARMTWMEPDLRAL